MARIENWWRRFWTPPDASLLQTGGQGEILISWFRLGISVTAIAIAYLASRQMGPTTPARVYLVVTVVALPVAGLIHIFVNRATYGWWIGFVTSILDVTFVSATLAMFLFLGQTQLALLNPVAFPVYFLALAATSMRLDHRACAAAGGIAVLQYGSIVGMGALGAADSPGGLTGIEIETQIVRVVLLAMMGGLGTLVNLRMQKPHVLSANDGLTGVLNRRAFEDRWSGEVARARRHGRPISIAAIDIDYFKQFNDTNGHAAGDIALRSVARVLENRIRGGDFLARIGGEEFVVALPETNSAAAMVVAEGLCRAVADNPIQIPGSRMAAHVTISIGVASWPENGEEITRLLERADDRLYEAKLNGRDQVKGPSPRLETRVAARV